MTLLPWVSLAEALGWAADDERPAWTYERPSTTVVASFCPHILAGPGYRKAGDGPRQNAPGSVAVSRSEASIIQTFPPDFPWQGPEGKVRQQIGNAVPPALALAILTDLTKEPTA